MADDVWSEGVDGHKSSDRGKLWEVIGGADKGGIIVRTGKELASSQERLRLSTGALILQLALEDGRLRYELRAGKGPETGWVSLRMSGKDLLVEIHSGNRREERAGIPPVDAPPAQAKKQTITARPSRQRQQHTAVEEAPQFVPPRGDLVAQVQYLIHDGEQPFNYMYQREDGGEQMHGQFEPKEVGITDGRVEAGQLSLDRHGVMLVPHCTALSTYDFYERPEKVWGEYYKEMRELVQQTTGASRVVVFDHNIRNPRDARWRRGVIGYVPYVHNDYTLDSAPQRVRDIAKPSSNHGSLGDEPVVLEEEVEQLLQKRYLIINVWRNISDTPIMGDPLAVADGSTIQNEQYIPADLIYKDRVGQTYSVTHDPGHRWLYFSGMHKDEAILLKCFDSIERAGVVRWTAHTGFSDPRSPSVAPIRESIDARCIAFFEGGDPERTGASAAALFPETFAPAGVDPPIE